jgi:hypothetical protein
MSTAARKYGGRRRKTVAVGLNKRELKALFIDPRTNLKDEELLLSQHRVRPEIIDILVSRQASPEDRPNLVQHDVSRGDIQSLVAAGFPSDA